MSSFCFTVQMFPLSYNPFSFNFSKLFLSSFIKTFSILVSFCFLFYSFRSSQHSESCQNVCQRLAADHEHFLFRSGGDLVVPMSFLRFAILTFYNFAVSILNMKLLSSLSLNYNFFHQQFLQPIHKLKLET